MRLVILTQVLDREDAVLGFFHGWCSEFARHVDRLTVFAQRVGDVDLPANVSVESLGKEEGGGKLTMLQRLLGGLLALRGGQRPDAVLVHMVPRFVLYAAPALSTRRVPLYLWYTHKGVDRNLRLAVPLVRKVFTASEESFRLRRAHGRRVVTGHGIDCKRFAPGPGPRSVDVLSVGRLAPSKGQDEVLAAVARLQPVPSVEIAGDILLDSDAEYRDRIASLARTQGARMLGAVPWLRMPDVMRRARVMVNASRTGSVDKVVLEAMACGTLPLTCNEAFAGVFGDGLAGRLMYREGDSADLAEKLRALLALPPGEADELGRALRRIAIEGHDLEWLIPLLVSEMEPKR
jgi:glycosyltransferase involved in cell wall biosynthesis